MKNPISARLNDVVAGRFRLKSISSEEVVFEDVNLGFRHKLAFYRPAPGENSSLSSGRSGSGGAYNPYNPNNRNPTINRNNPAIKGNPINGNDPTSNNNPTINQPQSIPGIPDNIPRYKPTPKPNPKKRRYR